MQQVKSQSTCSSARYIDTNAIENIDIGNEYWVAFNASADSLYLYIYEDSYPNLEIIVYGDSCNNLTLVDTLYGGGVHDIHGLMQGNNYYIKFSHSYLINVDIEVRDIPSYMYGENTKNPASPIETDYLIKDLGKGCFADFSFYAGYNVNQHLISYPARFIATDGQNTYTAPYTSPNWQVNLANFTPTITAGSYFVTLQFDPGNGYQDYYPGGGFNITVEELPSIDFSIMPDRICYNDLMTVDLLTPSQDMNYEYKLYYSVGTPLNHVLLQYSDFPFTYNPLQYGSTAAGSYDITIEAKNGCGTDSQTKSFDVGLLIDFETADYYCEGGASEFIATDACDPQYYPQNSEVIWEWAFGDGSIATSSTNSILHTYTNTGTYNVILTATLKNTITGDVITTNTVSKTIYVDESPDDIVIDGHMNDCDNHEKNYTIENYNSNYIYDITIDPPSCGSVTYNGGDNYTVAWDFYSQHYADMIVHASNSANPSCDRTTVYRVVKCCDEPDEPVQLNNIDSYSQLPQNIKTIFTSLSEDVIINGTLVIDEDVTISASYDHLFFGGNAKILVKPGYELEMDKVILKQACEYMWDGIYLPDISSKVSITDCEIYDAQNAVVSKSGGEYFIESTSIIDCYKGVVVKDYTPISNYPNPIPPHPGIIRNTTVTGNDDLLYLPYQNKQSRFGMDISKVNDLTIGDVSDPNNLYL